MKNFSTKNLFTLLLAIFILSNLTAQTFPYILEYETDTYSELEEATLLSTVGDTWDDPEYVIPIGFDFEFYDGTYTDVQVIGLGCWLAFQDPTNAQNINFLVPYLDDIIDIENADPATQSDISYSTEGLPGERILKMEWKNVGFYDEVTDAGTANNTLSFQVWLYEGSNNIEFRFGPSNLPDANLIHPFGSAVVGLIEGFNVNTDSIANFWHLSGDATSPTIVASDPSVFDTYMIPGLDSDPAEGQVYRFGTLPSSIKAPSQKLGLNVYPTVIEDEFFVEVDEEVFNEKTQLMILNNLGQIVWEDSINDIKEQINIANLPAGNYYVRVSNANGIGTKKIIKN